MRERKLSEEARARIITAYKSGARVDDLANAYNVSRSAIYYHLATITRWGRCIRCGTPMRPAGMCLPCLKAEGIR